MTSIFRCPVCSGILSKEEHSYYCDGAKKHCFDIASKGYVNLLTPDKKNSAVPGDNKQMVAARRDFLDAGFYSNLADELADVVNTHHNSGILIDAGCGEGYYTETIAKKLTAENKPFSIGAFDISKYACAYTSSRLKKYPNTETAVAGIFHIPIADSSADMLVTLFAPFCREEFSRILKDNGYMIMVIPSVRHLWELKEKIYDEPYENEPHSYEIDGFEHIEKRLVRNRIYLQNTEQIEQLFSMTPYYYKTDKKGHERVHALSSLETTTEFEILVYKKVGVK